MKFNTSKENYSPSLYYLDANNFGTDSILYDYKIEDKLEFTVLNFDNKDNSIMYNTPIFFSDLSNPITLKFTNTLIKNHPIKNTEKLVFDGSLLSKTPLKLEDLKASLSFDINITNYANEKFIANLNIEIPLKNEEKNIYDGGVWEIKNIDLPFLKEIK